MKSYYTATIQEHDHGSMTGWWTIQRARDSHQYNHADSPRHWPWLCGDAQLLASPGGPGLLWYWWTRPSQVGLLRWLPSLQGHIRAFPKVGHFWRLRANFHLGISLGKQSSWPHRHLQQSLRKTNLFSITSCKSWNSLCSFSSFSSSNLFSCSDAISERARTFLSCSSCHRLRPSWREPAPAFGVP